MERSVISHFPSLVSLSAQKSASLVLELLPSYAPLALERLQEEDSDRRKLYDVSNVGRRRHYLPLSRLSK